MRRLTLAAVLFFVVTLTSCTTSIESQMESAQSPVACSLSPEQLREHRQELLPGLFKRADDVTDIPDGLRLRFASHAGLLAEMAHIIEQEQMCCSFLRFHIAVEPNGGQITFEVSGPPGTREMLRGL